MHELSLAENILKIALAKAKENDIKTITKVNLCAGMHFYIEEKGLKECWHLIAKDSIASASELIIKLNKTESPEAYYIESIEGN